MDKGDNKRQKRKEIRSFLLGFTITITILIIFIGFFTVDYHGRRLSQGDDTPIFKVNEYIDGTAKLRINAFGEIKYYEFTKIKEIYEKFLDFCCIPYN